MKNILIFLLLLLFSCTPMNKDERLIKENLNSRYTGFEIIEIRPDSSNVRDAINSIRSLSLTTSSVNLDIIKALVEYEETTGASSKRNIFLYIDSLYSTNIESLEKFEKTYRFNTDEPCYFVEYLIYSGELKIPKREYFYIYNNNVWHRPYDWLEFMRERRYDRIIDEALKYSKDVRELRRKYGK